MNETQSEDVFARAEAHVHHVFAVTRDREMEPFLEVLHADGTVQVYLMRYETLRQKVETAAKMIADEAGRAVAYTFVEAGLALRVPPDLDPPAQRSWIGDHLALYGSVERSPERVERLVMLHNRDGVVWTRTYDVERRRGRVSALTNRVDDRTGTTADPLFGRLLAREGT